MIPEQPQINLDTPLAQRLQECVRSVEQRLHVGIVVQIDETIFLVVADIGCEKHHGVEEHAPVLYLVFERIERIDVVDLEKEDIADLLVAASRQQVVHTRGLRTDRNVVRSADDAQRHEVTLPGSDSEAPEVESHGCGVRRGPVGRDLDTPVPRERHPLRREEPAVRTVQGIVLLYVRGVEGHLRPGGGFEGLLQLQAHVSRSGILPTDRKRNIRPTRLVLQHPRNRSGRIRSQTVDDRDADLARPGRDHDLSRALHARVVLPHVQQQAVAVPTRIEPLRNLVGPLRGIRGDGKLHGFVPVRVEDDLLPGRDVQHGLALRGLRLDDLHIDCRGISRCEVQTPRAWSSRRIVPDIDLEDIALPLQQNPLRSRAVPRLGVGHDHQRRIFVPAGAEQERLRRGDRQAVTRIRRRLAAGEKNSRKK